LNEELEQLESKQAGGGHPPGAISALKPRSRKRRRVVRNVTSKSPTSTCAEIPILKTLGAAPEKKLSLKAVIKEVIESGKWFPELSQEDLVARHPNSKRKIVETALKFSRKNLVLKGELFPPSDIPGIWRIAGKGLERINDPEKVDRWRRKYSEHDAIIIEFEKSQT
jgi:hypothetical protein